MSVKSPPDVSLGVEAEDPLSLESPFPDPNLADYWDRMPEPVRRNLILRRKVWPRMHVRNENWMCVIVGETGSGKSYAAQRLAEVLDPNYGLGRTAWDVEGFLQLATEDYEAGAIQVLEEAGVAAGNRQWWDVANQVLDALTQTWRSINRGAIMTLPDLDLLDSHVRRRFHHIIIMESKDESKMISRARVKYVQTNHEYGQDYRKYHRMYDDDGVYRKFTSMRFRLPSESLLSDYEEAKAAFSEDLRGSLLEQLRAEKSDETDEKLLPADVVSKIIEEDRVDDYISESPGGPYVDRELIKLDFGATNTESKQAKKLLIREANLEGVM
jgi:energy-coupling factor transporter ATP-binding protein EcfA2